jgi:hypothetical protein
VISRVSTGSGFTKRELYSDDDDVVYTFYRVIGLNGINLVAEKADLLDRAILIGDLERIPETERKEDAVVWGQFEEVKPQVLGAMFETLSGAMRAFPEVTLTRLPRMADFARWGCAAATALGHRPETFMSVYDRNISGQHDEAIEANPIGKAILAFMADRQEWKGNASQLLHELKPVAEELSLDRHRLWPKNANWVWRRIKEVRINLQEKGVLCEMHRGDDRLIRIYGNGKNADGAVGADGDVDW